jgi:SAM-dependent methyltransferase
VTRRSLLASVRARLAPKRPATGGAEQPPEVAWKAAIDGEVEFWRRFFETKGARYPGSYETRMDPELPLDERIDALIHAPEGSTVRLLDVGAGPLTFLGRRSPRFTLELTAVDALGAQYGKLIDEFGLTPPVRTEACESERLSERFGPDTFDLVAARNTLDHSYDPMRAVAQMVGCAKPGAAVLLVHHRNEAEREQYRGMHQWNFEAGDDTVTIWRPGARHDVVAELAGAAALEQVWMDDTWEHIVLRKSGAPS